MKHFASPDFWACYRALPQEVHGLADAKFKLLKADPAHSSLRFRKVGRFWSYRVGLHYRVLGVDAPGGVLWFWIGPHTEYDRLIG